MISEPAKRLDAFRPRYLFRDARTGRFVSRVYALLWPQYTVRERKG